MFRIKALLALSALTVAGAFASSTAPASAFTSFNLWFNVTNNGLVDMKRQGSSLPTDVTGLAQPPIAIAPGSSDPSSGHGLFSASYPAVGQYVETSFVYANASDGSSSCTYTIRVTRNSASSFTAHFTSSAAARCTVPSDATNSDGQFTSTTYGLIWGN